LVNLGLYFLLIIQYVVDRIDHIYHIKVVIVVR